nr:ribonuclease H-like domain-containing protein [Tanacetum cinerariifolium]
MRVNHHNSARMTHPYSNKHVVPIAALTRSRLVPLNTVRPVTTAVPQTTMKTQRPVKHVVNKTHSPIIRPINHRPAPKNSNFHQKITTVKAKKVNVVQGTKGNWQALKDKGIIDSGCSRHMTENIYFLSNFEEINVGYVAYGGNPKGGKITGKGKIKTCKLDFDDVYFVKELKFNLFSVLQICDKKNSVLFTGTECVVLSSDFKLPDENHVLLRVPRENNMYNVDLNNIFPSRDLTCLFIKATLDESNLCHGLGPQKTLSFLFDVHGNPQQALKYKGIIDSGCSRHMTENIYFLSNFEEINGGYVAYGGNPKGGKITGKGKIKTGKLDFDDVYFVKELKFNLFSVLKICDKKNSVLFTGTECVVLSSDFKFPDENHVLLRVPRENNMYNVDLNNIFPSRDLTCLFIKATLDESNLWHRRLGHINFKTMNKLFKGSGPKWLFDIDTLTESMNYQPVVTGNQPNHNTGIQGNFDAGKVVKEAVSAQQYVLLPLWSTGSKDPQTDADAAFDVKENENIVHVSLSSSDKPKKHDENSKREAKGKSPLDLSTGVRDLRDKFEEFFVNTTNKVNAASAPVITVGPNLTNSTNSFNAASPSDNAVSLNFEIGRKSSIVDPSQYPDDPDMPALEDIVYLDDEEDVGAEVDFSNLETKISVSLVPTTRVHNDHLVSQIIGEFTSAPQTRSMERMGHTQEEGIDYEEVFALIARIEAIRLFLAYAFFMGFMIYQMDVKSDFLYGTIKEELYVCQPPGFEDPDYPDKVYKVVKALYELHQDPRAWYETLANYLLENGFQRGKID